MYKKSLNGVRLFVLCSQVDTIDYVILQFNHPQ